jgi:hypothetical protein
LIFKNQYKWKKKSLFMPTVKVQGLSKEDKEEAKGLKLRLGYHKISAVYLYLK